MQFLLDNQILVFTVAVFGIVFFVTLALFGTFSRSARVHARLDQARGYSATEELAGRRSIGHLLPRNIDETLFGLDEAERGQLRSDLLRAGYFSRQAVPMYLVVRVLVLGALPLLGWFYMSTIADGLNAGLRMAFVGILVFLGYYGPKAFISFRQRKLEQSYRETFPEMMDILVVCVDSGLSLEAALDRVAREIGETNRHLGINLSLMGMEMRAGRGTIQSLQGLAARLGIDEANSLVILLRQSSELGTSISESLRIYSDEMRDRRMSRAEEKAHALPAKLVLPLALFIFPVILIVVLTPVIVRIMGIIV